MSARRRTDTAALANHLGWKKFHLAGFSMTGMVVERLAVDVPERIKSVVAVGPVSAAGIKDVGCRPAVFRRCHHK